MLIRTGLALVGASTLYSRHFICLALMLLCLSAFLGSSIGRCDDMRQVHSRLPSKEWINKR
jgi:hypothetical protein